MAVDPTIPKVKNMLLLDSEGKRIAVKYYAPEWCGPNGVACRLGGGALGHPRAH